MLSGSSARALQLSACALSCCTCCYLALNPLACDRQTAPRGTRALAPAPGPRLVYTDGGIAPGPVRACTADEITRISQTSPHTRSNCPDNRAWMATLLEETAALSSATIMSVGCNTGDDFVSQMRDWSRDPRFAPSAYTAALRRLAGATQRACGGATAPTNAVRGSPRGVRGFCIEPMPSTFRLLEQAMSAMNYTDAVTLIQAAVSSSSGSTRFPDAAAGTENLGIGMGAGGVEVAMSTLDRIAAAHGIGDIEFLSIDTEGNDMRAVIGAVSTLSARKIRYLEFEYHAVGRWARSDLQDLVDLLDQLNFACYWALNSGGLSRLTGCWHDMYYQQRTWSNVACINWASPRTHAHMHALSA